MNGVIVTGTDTGIGKTVVSALLALKYEFPYWKPVQTGEPTDSGWVREILGPARVHPEAYRLRQPLSPDRAASLDSVTIDLERILATRPSTPSIIEGAGGLLVPLNDKEFIADLFFRLHSPLVVVAASRLGTINHTLLTLEAARHRGLTTLGVILNGPEDRGCAEVIARLGKTRILATVPRLERLNKYDLHTFAHQWEVSI